MSVVDEFWTRHLDAMDDLKQNIRLRAYGQEDPVVAFKRVSFEVFEEMTEAIQEEIVYRVFTFRLRQESVGRRRVTKARKAPTSSSVDTGKKEEVVTEDKGNREETPETNESDAAVGKVSNVAENEAEKPKREPIVLGRKIGPNELCPCGSGKKFKKCHGKNGNKRFISDDT